MVHDHSPKEVIEDGLRPAIRRFESQLRQSYDDAGPTACALEAQLIVVAMNEALGANGSISSVLAKQEDSKEGTIQDLAKALNAGEVETLVGPWRRSRFTTLRLTSISQQPFEQNARRHIVRLGYSEDETRSDGLFRIVFFQLPAGQGSKLSWGLPLAHYLE